MGTTGPDAPVSLVALSDGGGRSEPLRPSNGDAEWNAAHRYNCHVCNDVMCSHPTLCPGMSLEASPTTYPGFVAKMGVHVCVICADVEALANKFDAMSEGF